MPRIVPARNARHDPPERNKRWFRRSASQNCDDISPLADSPAEAHPDQTGLSRMTLRIEVNNQGPAGGEAWR